MKRADAITQSATGLVYRVKEDGFYAFEHKDEGVFIETQSGKVKRFGGNIGNDEDWEPAADGSEPYNVFTTKTARDPKTFIKETWEAAVSLSPISLAYRIKRDGGRMVRFSNGSTFSQFGKRFVLMDESTFKSYDGWKPLTQDSDLWELFSPYANRNPKNIKYINKTLMSSKIPPSLTPKFPTAPLNSVDPAVVEASSIIAKTLSDAYIKTIEVEGKVSKNAEELRDALLKLAKSTSWLMNENRGAYYAKGQNDGNPAP